MKKTVISAFRNEEYLLPWWLKHHKKMFDHGIMINCDSNDNSVNIIKDICPDWEIRDSIFDVFGAYQNDIEVEEIEKSVVGWRIFLNTTEFLMGDMSLLDKQSNPHPIGYQIPAMVMVDNEPDNLPDQKRDIIDQKRYGIHYNEDGFRIRRARLLHDKDGHKYTLGRHYEPYNTEDFILLWYGWSPFNEETIKRKVNIQNRIPKEDFSRGFSLEHRISVEELNNQYKTKFLPMARDLTEDLLPYIEIHNILK